MKRAGCVILAGIMAAGMCVGLAGCKKRLEFYTLPTAYREGLLSYEDLAKLEASIGYEAVNNLSPETQEMIKQEVLEHFDDFKGQLAYYEYTYDYYEYYSKNLGIVRRDFRIISYEGNYNGYEIMLVQLFESLLQAIHILSIEDLTFDQGDGRFYIAWANSENVTLIYQES